MAAPLLNTAFVKMKEKEDGYKVKKRTSRGKEEIGMGIPYSSIYTLQNVPCVKQEMNKKKSTPGRSQHKKNNNKLRIYLHNICITSAEILGGPQNDHLGKRGPLLLR